MSRRKSSGDQEFGSDSFLDIIANIVGILIILIVVAGAKVARQPEVITETVPEESTPALKTSVVTAPDTITELHSGNLSWPTAIQEDPFAGSAETDQPRSSELPSAPEFSENSSVADSLTSEIEALNLQVQQARDHSATSEVELKALLEQLKARKQNTALPTARANVFQHESNRLSKTIAELNSELQTTDASVNAIQSTLTSLTDRQRYVATALDQVAEETRQLKEVLDETDQNKATSDSLNHRMMPVSRAASNKEVFFRLFEGRIAQMPLRELERSAVRQSLSRRTSLRRVGRIEGMVGPIGGFRLIYEVRQQPVNSLRAIQTGRRPFQTMFSWKAVPAETLRTESVEEALRIGSRFRQVLEAAEPDTVVTIWVYETDFQHFAKFRSLAHRLNLRVAAWPMEVGKPVTATSGGSRSAAQ